MEATSTEKVAQNKFDLYYLTCSCGNQWNQVLTPPKVMFKCLRCNEEEIAETVVDRFWKGKSVDEYWETKGV